MSTPRDAPHAMSADPTRTNAADATYAAADFILIAGLWLTGSVWEQVADGLRRHGHQAEALTLPGHGDKRTD
ncbi:MAG: alpha/beta fold hydrolase, partial [Angustibacter sp.]